MAKKKFDNRDSIDFGSNDIATLFRRFFFPTLLGMLFSMAFVFTDGIFVGHGIGPRGLAAINLIGPIMMLINGMGMMFGMGVSVVVAIHLSHGNVKAARINTSQAFLAGIFVSLLLGAICYIFPNSVLMLLGVGTDMYNAAYEYYIWFIPTCLLMMIEGIGLFVIRLDGSPRYAMISNIIPSIINIVLDYVFIFPCKMGLMGASLATDIGGFVAVVMVAYYMFFRAKTLKLYKLKMTFMSLRLTLRNVSYIVKMGASGFVGELAVAVTMLTGNIMFNHYLGTDGVSAYSIACYLFPLIYMIINAVAQSSQPIISYNYGSGQHSRVRETIKLSMIISIVLGLVITAIFLLFPSIIVSIFINEDSQTAIIASDGLPYYSLGFVFLAINICMVGFYQSIEKAGLAVAVTLLRGVLLLVLAFIVMPIFLGTLGLWMAVPIAELSTTLVVMILYVARKRKDSF